MWEVEKKVSEVAESRLDGEKKRERDSQRTGR